MDKKDTMKGSNVKTFDDSDTSEDEETIRIEADKKLLLEEEEIFKGNANYMLFLGQIDQGIISR